jgi:hypothetical protein
MVARTFGRKDAAVRVKKAASLSVPPPSPPQPGPGIPPRRA